MSARGAAMLALALDGTTVVDASRRLSAESRLVRPQSGEAESARRLLERYRQASGQGVQWRHHESPSPYSVS
jgi:hypothetical protein